MACASSGTRGGGTFYDPAQSPDARLRPDHPAAPLFDTLRAQFPASVSDAHALDATLKAHAEGITARDAKGVVHEDRAWVMSPQLTGPRASSDLTTPPIALEESIQRSARSDATAAKQVEPTDAQIAPVAVQRHGPSRSRRRRMACRERTSRSETSAAAETSGSQHGSQRCVTATAAMPVPGGRPQLKAKR